MNSEQERDHPESEYRHHMQGLEACATRLEDGSLDPQEALAVYREAQEHYRAVDKILSSVEHEIDLIQKDRDRSKDG